MKHIQPAVNKGSCTRFNVRGFSLIEIMIALVIGLILVAGTMKIYVSSKQGYRVQNVLGQLQETGRYGIGLIADDIRRAGYLGGNADTALIGGSMGVVPVTDSCSTGDNSWGRMIDQPIFGLDDTNALYDCISSDEYLRGDVLVIRYASENVIETFEANRLYLRSALFSARIFKGVDEHFNTLPDNPQSTRELVAHGYFIGSSSEQCTDGSEIPALFWKYLDDDGIPQSEELLIGADNLQIRYGVDVNNDLSADQYLDADVISTNAAFNWNQVVSVRLWLLVGSGCPESAFTDSNTYSMGDQSYQPGSSLLHQLYSTTVSLRN